MRNIPAELKYTRDHEWLRREPHGAVTAGVTHFAQSQLGDAVMVDHQSNAGATLAADDEVATVESVKAVADLLSPPWRVAGIQRGTG